MADYAILVHGRTYAAELVEVKGYPNSCSGCALFVKPKACARVDMTPRECKEKFGAIFKLEVHNAR